VSLLRAHIVTAGDSPDARVFDLVRTKLLHQMRTHNWKRIAITSPGPGCGKTTVALNLAFGLARHMDLRVVLAETDLHRPTMAKVLNARVVTGSPSCSKGDRCSRIAPCACVPNLAVLLAPGARRQAAELLQSPSTKAVLDGIEAALDPGVVLFDLPPTLASSDVLAFAENVDAALIIAAAGLTTVAEIDACERELATRTNVVGVVMNRCLYLDQEYGPTHDAARRAHGLISGPRTH
jgi:Mrp family chromosome partitioning ATPase